MSYISSVDPVSLPGEIANAQSCEGLHKFLKLTRKNANHQNNLLHIARRKNHDSAVRFMLEGGSWTARRYNYKENAWETRRIKAGVGCLEMLKSLSDEPRRTFGMGRARGTAKWTVEVGDRGKVRAATSTPGGWELAATRAIEHLDLELEYSRWFGGEREQLRYTSAVCFNIWDDAPAEATGGHRTIRGGPVHDAEKHQGARWCLAAAAPLGTNIELYSTPEANRLRKPGPAGTCTLGKVACFVEHRGNDGAETLWVAVAEYVTVGRGKARENDPATGHAVLRLKKTLSFFPATAIRRLAHMYHRCTSACKAVPGVNGGASIWRHDTLSAGGDCFLYNEHYHITGT